MGSADAGYVDPVFAKRLEEARASGYDQGFADGAKAAEAAARRSAEAAAARLRSGADEAVRALQATTIDLVPGLIDLAVRIARRIVAEVPEQLSASLVDRIASALTLIDDEGLTVFVSPGDVGEVSAGFATTPALTVVPDPALGQGEARVDGPWAHADLTLPIAWSIIEGELSA
jgi:flagellar biosynthesis/type III secretory pathway protein FliH